MSLLQESVPANHIIKSTPLPIIRISISIIVRAHSHVIILHLKTQLIVVRTSFSPYVTTYSSPVRRNILHIFPPTPQLNFALVLESNSFCRLNNELRSKLES